MQVLHPSAAPRNASLLVNRQLPAGWVRIRLKMTAAMPGRFKLFAEPGNGVCSATCLLNLEVAGAAEYDGFVAINSPVSELWSDTPGGPGEFRLDYLRIEPLTGLQAFGHALFSKVKLLRKYWHTKQAIGRALGMLARGDFARLRRKLFQGLNGPDLEGREPYDEAAAYDAWRLSRRLTDHDRAGLRAQAHALANPPSFSVLLTLSGRCALDARTSIESVLRQTYPFWELCISFGVSADSAIKTMVAEVARLDIRVRFRETADSFGGAAAANAALACASGNFVTILDENDELAEHALSKLCETVVADSALDMLYADEDRLTSEEKYVTPYFKPGWSPETLLSAMYTGRPGVYRTSLVRELGGFRTEYGPAYEYDLVLRMTTGSQHVRHVADVLYHRRTRTTPASMMDEAARRALQNHLNQTERTGTVEPGPGPGLHQTRFTLRGAPVVSIIIASACRRVRIRSEYTYYILKCLESIQKTTWSHYEVIVLHSGKIPAVIDAKMKELGIGCAAYDRPFNWSRAMNRGAALSKGEHLLFLNDDVEVITPDWLERMLEFSQQAAVGAVGAKLFFPSGRIQHAGVAVLDGRPLHPFYAHTGEHPGYFNNLLVPRNCCAVTGACLMTCAEVFRAAGGFDEAMPLNYNDVDYCLRLIAGGKRVVCTPYARLYHHELGTRRAGVEPEETAALQQRWGMAWANDPYYNPNLSTSHFDYRIRSAAVESAGPHASE